MMMQQKERVLLRKAVQGDVSAFGEVIKIYQHVVYAVALQIAKDPVAAQDIAQDTFATAFEALRDLRSEDAFPSWLHTITRNAAFAWCKAQGRIASLEEARQVQSPPEPLWIETDSDRNEAEAFRAEVWRIISSLSDNLRFPMLLCYVDNISTAEAARFLGIREGTLRKRLHDGKKKLQNRIVAMAEKTFQEYRLPAGFARRCICGCRKAIGKKPKGRLGKGQGTAKKAAGRGPHQGT